jgi:hypothetical protein
MFRGRLPGEGHSVAKLLAHSGRSIKPAIGPEATATDEDEEIRRFFP